jgi:DNA-directed RNA polymerase subunit RPC12/RpoP
MQNTPEINKSDINRFLCPNCAGNMIFSPETQALQCPYCNHAKQVETAGTVEERDYFTYLQVDSAKLQPMATNAMQVGCNGCGAIVNFTPPETATWCNFCGSKIVAQPKASDPLVAPEGVLPFGVPQDAAKKSFNTWIGSRWFAPSALKNMSQAERLSSIYIPYWTFDAYSTSSYTGERGDHYYDTEYYEEDGERRSRQVQHTNWYSRNGQVSRQFDDVTVPATTSVLPKYVEKLNFDFTDLVPYEPAYLAGHKAQTYQVPLAEGFERFKEKAYNVIHSDCENDIGGDEQRVHHIDINYANITFKHLLVPVYASAYQFKGKAFQIVINGRTGEVQGERPYSWLKIGCLTIAIISAILFIIILFAALKK